MEAKDTVMSPEEQDNCTATKEQLENYLARPDDRVAVSLDLVEKKLVAKAILYGENIAQAQAGITWNKAIREVVEWINDTDIMVMLSPRKRREWQAKLKEWGIK